MTLKTPKVIFLTNDAIDRMDEFAARAIDGELGGRGDYWSELQAIVDAGVSFENAAPAAAECRKKGVGMEYYIAVKVTDNDDGKSYVEVNGRSPLNRRYFAARVEPGALTAATRQALVEALALAIDDIIDVNGQRSAQGDG